jgi:hypothetical protein
MAEHYRSKIAEGLKELFPGLSDSDAAALSWEGLLETYEWSVVKLRSMQDQTNTAYNIIQTVLDYQKLVKGTKPGC